MNAEYKNNRPPPAARPCKILNAGHDLPVATRTQRGPLRRSGPSSLPGTAGRRRLADRFFATFGRASDQSQSAPGSEASILLKRLWIEIRTDACEPQGIVPEGGRDARAGAILVVFVLQLLLLRGNFDQSYEQTLAPTYIIATDR